MDHYMIISYSRDSKLSLKNHKVVCGKLSKEEVNLCKHQLSEQFDFDVIRFLLEICQHDKTCPCKENHSKVFSGLDYLKNRSFYSRKLGHPIYGLLIKVLEGKFNGDFTDIGVKIIEDYILVDYFYNLESLNQIYQRYEPLVKEGKILLKVWTREHPIDIKYVLDIITEMEL